jgi:hypothetical protein
MFLCTVLIVKELFMTQTSDNQQLANNTQRNCHISIMLLLMCLTYVILTLPNRLYFSVFAVRQLILTCCRRLANQVVLHESNTREHPDTITMLHGPV